VKNSGLRSGSAWTRLGWSVLAGVAVGLLLGWLAGWTWGVLTGLAVGGVAFSVLAWAHMWPLDAAATKAHVERDEFRPAAEELAIGSMVTIGIVATLVIGVVGTGDAQKGAGVLALVAVLAQWFSLHSMYATRYAYEFYDDVDGGIDFNDKESPRYSDFLYFSYNLGMTYQVSDTAVTSSRVRSVVLRHCLLSFLFSLTILATAINVVAGIVLG
jgi:uncharacterized membrane protein